MLFLGSAAVFHRGLQQISHQIILLPLIPDLRGCAVHHHHHHHQQHHHHHHRCGIQPHRHPLLEYIMIKEQQLNLKSLEHRLNESELPSVVRDPQETIIFRTKEDVQFMEIIKDIPSERRHVPRDIV